MDESEGAALHFSSDHCGTLFEALHAGAAQPLQIHLLGTEVIEKVCGKKFLFVNVTFGYDSFIIQSTPRL